MKGLELLLANYLIDLLKAKCLLIPLSCRVFCLPAFVRDDWSSGETAGRLVCNVCMGIRGYMYLCVIV